MKSAMAKNITDYLPKKKENKKHLIQIKVPLALVREVKPYLKSHEMTWTDVVNACLMNFRDTVVKKK